MASDADIVIFDQDYTGRISVETSLQDIDFNSYEGFEQSGRPEKAFLRGKMTVDGGKSIVRPGQGNFIECEPYGLAYAGRTGN